MRAMRAPGWFLCVLANVSAFAAPAPFTESDFRATLGVADAVRL